MANQVAVRKRMREIANQPEAYPDPKEVDEIWEDRIDYAEFGLLITIREWRGANDQVEQFALTLNVTPAHIAYESCKKLKGNVRNFSQVRRTDTWHSCIHSHQFFINQELEDFELHAELSGGGALENSQRRVHADYNRLYNELVNNPFVYVERWEAGK